MALQKHSASHCLGTVALQSQLKAVAMLVGEHDADELVVWPADDVAPRQILACACASGWKGGMRARPDGL